VHGYGRKAKGLKQVYGKGIDDAELVTRYKTDPIMGGTGMNVNFVTFLRAADVDAAAAQPEAEQAGTPVSENEVAAGVGSRAAPESEARFRKGVAV
jgi:hypothetical protein